MPRTGEPIVIERPVSWVALVGFMGTGKSRIGWELSRALALHFVDTDKVIERITGLTIPQIFELYGEPTFRAYETEIVDRCIALDEAVVSCGGGTFINEENRQKLLERGPSLNAPNAAPAHSYKFQTLSGESTSCSRCANLFSMPHPFRFPPMGVIAKRSWQRSLRGSRLGMTVLNLIRAVWENTSERSSSQARARIYRQD
jgi:hypothetical protein